MLKNIKKRLKNQRGVTLVELLAVVVILGIIAAIAVPNIGGIIDKTKKDAHISNAQQMADAARLFVLGENISITSGNTQNIVLADLVGKGYIETMVNPSGGTYNAGTSNYSTPATFTGTLSNVATGSYVAVTKQAGGAYKYRVVLLGTSPATTHYDGDPFTHKAATL